jgi:hypothetical protein
MKCLGLDTLDNQIKLALHCRFPWGTRSIVSLSVPTDPVVVDLNGTNSL